MPVTGSHLSPSLFKDCKRWSDADNSAWIQAPGKKNPYDKGVLEAALCVPLCVNATSSGLPRTLYGPPRSYLSPVTREASRIVKEGRRNAGGFPLSFSFSEDGEGELKQARALPWKRVEENRRKLSATLLAASPPPPRPHRAPAPGQKPEAGGHSFVSGFGGQGTQKQPGPGEDLSSKPLLTPSQGTQWITRKPTSQGEREGERPFRARARFPAPSSTLPARPPGRAAGTWSPLAASRSGARAPAPPPVSYPPRAPAPAPPAAPALRAAAPPPQPARVPGLAPPSRLCQPHSGRQPRGPKEGRTDASPHPGYRIRLRPPSAASASAAAAAMSKGHVSAAAPPPGWGCTASEAESGWALAVWWRPLLGDSWNDESKPAAPISPTLNTPTVLMPTGTRSLYLLRTHDHAVFRGPRPCFFQFSLLSSVSLCLVTSSVSPWLTPPIHKDLNSGQFFHWGFPIAFTRSSFFSISVLAFKTKEGNLPPPS